MEKVGESTHELMEGRSPQVNFTHSVSQSSRLLSYITVQYVEGNMRMRMRAGSVRVIQHDHSIVDCGERSRRDNISVRQWGPNLPSFFLIKCEVFEVF